MAMDFILMQTLKIKTESWMLLKLSKQWDQYKKWILNAFKTKETLRPVSMKTANPD